MLNNEVEGGGDRKMKKDWDGIKTSHTITCKRCGLKTEVNMGVMVKHPDNARFVAYVDELKADKQTEKVTVWDKIYWWFKVKLRLTKKGVG